MSKFSAIFMLAAAMLPALGQAQTTDICGRTPAVRDAILTVFSHSNCATVPNASLSGFSDRLDLRNQGLTALANGDFAGLTSLKFLFLNGNQLTTLPEGAFDGLTSLRELWLHNNQLRALPDGVFDGLTRLEKLRLEGNQLTALPEGVFAGLTSLWVLELYSNQLTTLPEGLFAGLTRLEWLWLNDNQLTAVPEGLFAGLTSPHTLWLEGNQLTTLPEGLFAGLTSLHTLRLGGNQLTAVPEGLFAGLTSLHTLRLGGNQLTALPEGVFAGLTSLQELLLNDNQLTATPEGVFAGLTRLDTLWLHGNRLAELPEGIFDGLTSLRMLWLSGNRLAELPEGAFDDLTNLKYLGLSDNQLTALPEGAFDGLTRLEWLYLHDNQLTALPEGAFDGLTGLQRLYLYNNPLVGLTPNDPLFAGLPSGVDLQLGGQTQPDNICGRTQQVRDAIMQAVDANDCAAVDSESQARVARLNIAEQGLTSLRADDFDGLTRLQELLLDGNQLAALPEGVFDSLTSLEFLWLNDNQLTSLRADDFDGLTSLQYLGLHNNQLAALPEGVFDSLTSLQYLHLRNNQLAELPEGVFDGLTSLQYLGLHNNQLAALPEGVFDSLTSLQELHLEHNQLAALPEGVFDGLTSLIWLGLNGNQLAGLTPNDPLFAELLGVELYLGWQTEPPELPARRLAAAVPLLVSASDSMRQGFVRIINDSDESGSVRILAFDDGGTAANPVEFSLNGNRGFHFNAGDLENGNANKRISAGIGSLAQGDWRLDVETALSVRVLAFARTGDGFLTAMHDVLQRDSRGRLAAWTFNPASNTSRVSRLRLVNTGTKPENVSIGGVDDQGDSGGSVTLTLAAGESRTLSALDLEDGAQGLTGTLGDGAGKWRLFVTAAQSVVGASLLDSASGHLSNLSTGGNDGSVPLLVSASDSMRQGFVRIINESDESGTVRVLAFDDAGTAATPVEIQLGANRAFHFNAGDLENGNANKGINAGIGSPVQGHWRLDVETALDVRVLAFVRTGDGFLTAMHDVLQRDSQGRLTAWTFNPASNTDRVSRLRLVNTGATAESVSIEGVDDQGESAGPVSLTLAAGESRTLSANDLENGAQGLTGTLGAGAGKWRLYMTAGQSVAGVSLLDSASGHLSNLSTQGVAVEGQ